MMGRQKISLKKLKKNKCPTNDCDGKLEDKDKGRRKVKSCPECGFGITPDRKEQIIEQGDLTV